MDGSVTRVVPTSDEIKVLFLGDTVENDVDEGNVV